MYEEKYITSACTLVAKILMKMKTIVGMRAGSASLSFPDGFLVSAIS